jgi:type IV secretory pathway TrbD component
VAGLMGDDRKWLSVLTGIIAAVLLLLLLLWNGFA